MRLPGTHSRRNDLLRRGPQPYVAEYLPALLAQARHIVKARAETFDSRRHPQDGAQRYHARAADAGDQKIKAITDLGHRGGGKSSYGDEVRARSAAWSSTRDSHEGGTEAFYAREILVAG